MRKLAKTLNDWSLNNHAIVSEQSDLIIVSELDTSNAKRLLEFCTALEWSYEATDGSDTNCNIGDIDQAIAPVRVDVHKPSVDDGVYLCVTERGFEALMDEEPTHLTRIYVSTLENSFKSKLSQFLPWASEADQLTISECKKPRDLVKCFGGVNRVPKDVRSWLLYDMDFDPNTRCPIFNIWAGHASNNLLYSIASEVNFEAKWIDFIGPPKLRVELNPEDRDLYTEIGIEGFFALQRAASWVYEDPTSSEQRLIYLAAEFARSCSNHEQISHHISRNLSHALEGAKIAYRLGLSEISLSTLNALSQLRATVSDETSKISDSTRQMTTSILAAVASGAALIIVRLNANTNVWVIGCLTVVIFAYLMWVSVSGHKFLGIQRKLREQWKQRLYRFLTEKEYSAMVDEPIEQAERTYMLSIAAAFICAIFLVSAVIFTVMSPQ